MKPVKNKDLIAFLIGFGLVILVFCFIRSAMSEDYIEDKTRHEKIEQLVDYLNKEAKRTMPEETTTFACHNIDTHMPVLEITCFICSRWKHCTSCPKRIKGIVLNFSETWNMLVNNKRVDVYNGYSEKVYYIDITGEFLVVKDYL